MVQVLPVLGEPAAAIEPSDATLDDPSFGQNRKSLRLIGPLDDLHIDLAQHTFQSGAERRTLVAAIGVELAQEGEQAEQRCHHQHAAVAILQGRRMDHRVQDQAQGVDQEMALLSLDLLARIEAVRINPAPPFSALFTLWLSMIAAVGLASRPACSRHCT